MDERNDAIARFTAEHPILENRVKLIEVSYLERSNDGMVYVECYLLKGTKV